MEQTQALLGGRKHNIELGMVSLPHCLFSFFFSLFFLFSSSVVVVVVVVDSQQPEQGCVREGGSGGLQGLRTHTWSPSAPPQVHLSPASITSLQASHHHLHRGVKFCKLKKGGRKG